VDSRDDRTRRRRALDVTAAVLAALLAFTAVPAVLVLVVGNPLSGGLGHTWRPVPRDALCVLAVAAWVAWAACCAQLARAVVAHVRDGDVGTTGDASVMDRIATRIAVGVMTLTTVGAPLALPSVGGASTPSTSQAAAGPVPTAHPGTPALGTLVSATHAVRPGDTLWSIAEERLADGADWTSIAALNLGRDMDLSTRFVDPDHVEAGWRLRLPPTTDAWTTGAPRVGPRHAGAPDHGDRLPELVALGMGSLACAALARRARKRRRVDPFTGDLDLEWALSDEATDADSLLQRFAEIPALHSFETANSLLSRALQGDAARPVVRAICVAPSGVSFWLTEPRSDPPDEFVALHGGAAWHVDHAALRDDDTLSPYVPIALPIGEDEEGTWLVALGPGSVLPLLGESAPELARSTRSAAGAWAWSDTVLVTDDPGDPGLGSVGPAGAPHRVFFGDPGTLSSPVAARTAVVTTATVAATDLTVLVDRRGATLHPIGRVVRPHLQSAETARHLRELTAPPGPREAAPPGPREAAPPVAHALRRPGRGAGDGTAAVAPGPVDVRLLTMTPRLDGLREDLPPNRARRAVELVAYLALHQPDVITGDRLRTRVLGSSDADAASKTLFNTAHAARRAMGVDQLGAPLFPAGTRNGLYQVSPQVTVDVHRAITHAEAGKAQTDPDLAIAHYRAALQLVEGEPLANALSGYTWWEAEGHGGRIAAVLVDAACSMAALASGAGHLDLARWGLERARLVEPYSEALSRAAMQLAAAEGDADRLRLEWRECQRRVDALDPGSSPSPRTESLYGELSRRVLVDAGSSDLRRPRYAPVAGD
jgi:DNA-binding SARP family transcriptional activator